MSNFQSGYTESHALIIDTGTLFQTEIKRFAEVLAHPPYKFTVTHLAGSNVTCTAINESLVRLSTVDPDTRILLFINGEISIDDGIANLLCTTTSQSSKNVFAINDFLVLHKTSKAKHIVVILDIILGIGIINDFVEIGTPYAENTLKHTSYQIMIRSPLAKRSLASTLLTYLHSNEAQNVNPISIFSIIYDTNDVHPSYHFYLKGSDRGDFHFLPSSFIG